MHFLYLVLGLLGAAWVAVGKFKNSVTSLPIGIISAAFILGSAYLYARSRERPGGS